MMQPTTTAVPFRRRALMMGAIALVIVFILWNIPQLSFLLFPFRMFVTFAHEAGHGLMAILSGGHFRAFTISPNGSGFATTAGGARALILPAGYLGAAFIGAVLFYLTNTLPFPRHLSVVLGALVILIGVMFGGLLSLATLMGVLIGGALILVGWKADQNVNLVVLNTLAVLTGLNAILDLFFLMGNSQLMARNASNDALAFQREVAPLIPAAVWAFLWSALALIMLGAAVYFSIIKPLRRKRDDL